MHFSFLHFCILFPIFSFVIFFTLHLQTNQYFSCSLDPLCLSYLIHLVFLTCDSVVSLSSSFSSIRIVYFHHLNLCSICLVSTYCIIPSLLYSRVLPWKISHPQAVLCSKKQTLDSIRRPGPSCRRGKVSFYRGKRVSGGGLVSGNDKDKRWQHDRREERRAGERRTMHPECRSS